MEKEKAMAFGVSIPLLEMETIESLIYDDPSDKTKQIWEVAEKNNCLGVLPKDNNMIYLFLLHTEQIGFYNNIKQLVKDAKLLETCIQVERTMPEKLGKA